MIFASNPTNWWTSHLGCNFHRLKSWLVNEGFSEGTVFFCTFRISEVVNSIKESGVIFFSLLVFIEALLRENGGKYPRWGLTSLCLCWGQTKVCLFFPLFGRFSAWFFFNGMVWNMLKLPLALWLEGFLLKCVIVVLASRVQFTPMVFADVSILWCLHACLSTCWVSTQKCL